MDLETLRSKCKVRVQDMNPKIYMPKIDDAVRKSIRTATTAMGGIQRTTTITTVSGTRDYGISAGFPEDFISVHSIFRDVDIEILPMLRVDRLKQGSGTPSYWYIYGREIGFDIIPSGAYELEFNYYGSGDDATADDDEILSEISMMDDDPAWDAILDAFAVEYYDRRRAYAVVQNLDADIRRFNEMLQIKRQELKLSQGLFLRRINAYNKQRAMQVRLPRDYAGRQYGESFRDRASNDGDTFQMLR